MGQFALVDGTDIATIPTATWMVEGMMPTASLGLLYSPPASGKSFLALDLALSIATGTPWLGHEVVTGESVYVVGEGAGDVALRVQAWLASHGLREDALSRFRLVLGAVDLATNEADILADQLASRTSLYVFDTLQRCNSASENSVSGMASVIEACARLQVAGASVLLLHHSSKGDIEVERGSSALRGAADVVYRLERQGPEVSLICEKMKVAAEPADQALTLTPVSSSLVIGLAPTPDVSLPLFNAILALGDSGTLTQWRARYSAPPWDKWNTTDFVTVVRGCVESGLVEKWQGGYFMPTSKATNYLASLPAA